MDARWLSRTIRLSLWLGGGLGLAAVMTGHPAWAPGILLGAWWGAVNLLLWSRLLGSILTPGPQPPWPMMRVWAAIVLKFPALYGGGYLLVVILRAWGWSEPAGLLVGVSLPLAVLTLKAVGQSSDSGASGAYGPALDQGPPLLSSGQRHRG